MDALLPDMRDTLSTGSVAGPERRRIALQVNGRSMEGWAESRRTLADFLRHDLGLTGTHIGCEQGVCGACTVL